MSPPVVEAYGVRLVVLQCGTCAVTHALPEIIYQTAYQQGGFWHCPNGHSRGWKEGAEKREMDDLRRERDRLKQHNAQLHDERFAALRARDAAQTSLRRHKKRAAAGLCPCCNRSFVNMQRHMKTQHPDYNVVPIRK